MFSTKESENKDAKCMFCNRIFFKNERGEIWIKCYSCSLWAHMDCTASVNTEYIYDFINRIEAEMTSA